MVCEALRNNDGAFYSRTTTVDSELIEKNEFSQYNKSVRYTVGKGLTLTEAKEEVRSFVGLCVDAPDNEVVMNVLDSCLNNSAREASIQLNSFDFNTKREGEFTVSVSLGNAHVVSKLFGAHVRESINYSGCYDMCAIFGFVQFQLAPNILIQRYHTTTSIIFLSSTETVRYEKKYVEQNLNSNDVVYFANDTLRAAATRLHTLFDQLVSS
eukprot:gene9231-6484_t